MSGIVFACIVNVLFIIYASVLTVRGPEALYHDRCALILFRLWRNFTCIPILVFVVMLEILLLCQPGLIIRADTIDQLSSLIGVTKVQLVGILMSIHILLLCVLHRLCTTVAVGDFVEKCDLLKDLIADQMHFFVDKGSQRTTFRFGITQSGRVFQMFLLEFAGFFILISTMYIYFV